MKHLAGAAALAGPAINFTTALQANAATLKKNQTAAILLWMGGGPATIDMWDLKPDSSTGGPFKPIATSGDMQISEHLPLLAQQMHHLSIVRSMSTREADHGRGRYYMHTGYVPNPSVEHPSYGSVIAHQLAPSRTELEIPPFVSVGGGSVGPGFLGMTYAPFVVNNNGRIQDLEMGISRERMLERLKLLDTLEGRFIRQDRGLAASEHAKVLEKTKALMTSEQMQAFEVNQEPQAVRDKYGTSGFGRGCLMARRLVEAGVPFVEVDLGGWDTHSDNFNRLETNLLPTLDQAMSALVADLADRDLLKTTAVLWMGEFGRTPRINGNTGRDHWANSWSVMIGGGGLKSGIAVGQTSPDGDRVEGKSYQPGDIWATVAQALGIPVKTVHKSKRGRPMKIANGGTPIKELIG